MVSRVDSWWLTVARPDGQQRLMELIYCFRDLWGFLEFWRISQWMSSTLGSIQTWNGVYLLIQICSLCVVVFLDPITIVIHFKLVIERERENMAMVIQIRHQYDRLIQPPVPEMSSNREYWGIHGINLFINLSTGRKSAKYRQSRSE